MTRYELREFLVAFLGALLAVFAAVMFVALIGAIVMPFVDEEPKPAKVLYLLLSSPFIGGEGQ